MFRLTFSYFFFKGGTRLSDDNHNWIFSNIQASANGWKTLGRELGFKNPELEFIGIGSASQGPMGCLSEMLRQWLQWAPGDGRDSESFATKELLVAALLRANMGTTAAKFY